MGHAPPSDTHRMAAHHLYIALIMNTESLSCLAALVNRAQAAKVARVVRSMGTPLVGILS